MKITNLKAREILDSRGNPTISVELTLEDGSLGIASVPSGASTGKYEAVELRDVDLDRYGGKGVSIAIAKIEGEIAHQLVGQDYDQTSLDHKLITLDGTPNKSHLGANAILGVSLAFAHATARAEGVELFEYFGKLTSAQAVRDPISGSLEIGSRTASHSFPVPMFNILNGGRHADSVDLQEFMVVPTGAPNFKEALRFGEEIYQALKKILTAKGLDTDIGDEGGFAPNLEKSTQALDLIVEAIEQAGYTDKVSIALDVAASELRVGDLPDGKTGHYELKKEKEEFTTEGLINYYRDLITKYPIISIEDGLAEDDWQGWQELTKQLGSQINLVGDDLFVTNPIRLKQGIEQKVANAIIIKPNQIGTITETLEVIKMAQTAGYKIIVSHRSGETEDTTIADLAVGVQADFIKAGAPARSERLAKYNRLLKIEDQL